MKKYTEEEFKEKVRRSEIPAGRYRKCHICRKIIYRKEAMEKGYSVKQNEMKEKEWLEVVKGELGSLKINNNTRHTKVVYTCSKEHHTMTAL